VVYGAILLLVGVEEYITAEMVHGEEVNDL
jgi:hypothetical protein